MRKIPLFLAVPLFLALSAVVPAFDGPPPNKPEVTGSVLYQIPVSTTSVNVFTSSYCAYPAAHSLSAKKNGQTVTLSITNVVTTSPQSGQKDVTYTVNLTPLNLQSGDTLQWTFLAWATDGPQKNQRSSFIMNSVVIP